MYSIQHNKCVQSELLWQTCRETVILKHNCLPWIVIHSVLSIIMLLLSMITDTGTYFINSLSPIIAVNGDAEAGSNLCMCYLDWLINEHYYQNNKTCTHKAIPEIFLTGLLSTEGTIQKFVDDYFNTILTANKALHPAVKWMFGHLDYAAMKHNITESEVVHALKSNKWVTTC